MEKGSGCLKMLLFGDAGAGKSTLLNHIALNAYANPSRIGLDKPRIPLLLPLKEMSQVTSSLNLPEWIAAAAQASRVRIGGLESFQDPVTCQDAFEEMAMRSGAPWLVLLDGCDEVPIERLKELHRNIRRCVGLPRLDWVITSRATASHASTIVDLIHDFTMPAFALSTWNEPQLRAFASCFLEDDPQPFLSQYAELISGDSAFTPLLALLAICVFKEQSGMLPDTRVELYDLFVENAVLRARRRAGDSLPNWIGREDSQSLVGLLEHLALQSSYNPDCTHKDDFRDLLLKRMQENYGLAEAPARLQSSELVQHIGVGSGLLVREQDSIRWWHASVRDFLTGCALSELLVKNESAFECHWDKPEFSEACVFCLVRTSLKHAKHPSRYPDIAPLVRRCMDKNFTVQLYHVVAEGARFSDGLGDYLAQCLVDGAIRVRAKQECEIWNRDLQRQGRSPVDMLKKLRKYPAALRGLERIADDQSLLPWMREQAEVALVQIRDRIK